MMPKFDKAMIPQKCVFSLFQTRDNELWLIMYLYVHLDMQ